ncbi:MAG TPA: C39 family peptidase [Solirubrobacterales bacterium]|nr:C39 family peptidase [Solirubrobacterales bacterium]
MSSPTGGKRQPDRRAAPPSRAAIRRRRLTALLVVVLAAAVLTVALWPAGEQRREASRTVTLKVPGRKGLVLQRADARRIAAEQMTLPVPGRRSVQRGSATITYKLDRELARRQLSRAARAGGEVTVKERPVGVLIEAPVIEQVYPNNCETAALQMLLATRGIERDQRRLQDELRRDGPLDPKSAEDGTRIWGNPRFGFVGRPEGGGVAGGFGAYPRPVLALADRWVDAVNLTGRRPQAIYRRLLAGHAVLAWIGLSDGPYESWRGPRGEVVTVNWGEHTVLLRGLAGDRLLVNDPLSGEKQLWSKAEFEERWAMMGERAISA